MLKSFFSPPQFVVAVILLSTTLALSHGIEFREKIPISKSFELFPMTIGEWSGSRQRMEQKFIDTLDLSDYLIVDYSDPRKDLNFMLLIIKANKRVDRSIRRPPACPAAAGFSNRPEPSNMPF